MTIVVNKAVTSGLPLMRVLKFKGKQTLEQLHLEEKLFRSSADNWCIVNDGSDAPTIVMGMSGKASELEIGLVLQDQVPVIRRFTGGGTVIVDQGTIFITFICNKIDTLKVNPYPRSIMSWSGLLYREVFQGIDDFQLRENDYVFGDRKFGGNAQSISKSRWIHHTSFLWDYDVRNMIYLKIPSRVPNYRLGRNHVEFLCKIKEYLPRSTVIEKTQVALQSYFTVKPINMREINLFHLSKDTLSTKLLSAHELEVLPESSVFF